MALEVRSKYPIPHPRRAPHKLPQRILKREQRRQSIKRAFNTFLVLGILAAGAGMAYTWYMGKQKPEAAAMQSAPVSHGPAVFKPPKIPSDAKIGTAIQMNTTEVKAGENASMSVRTNPEADCMIVVKYGTVVAKDSGLILKQADEYGMVDWAWSVPVGTPPGKSSVEVTCKNKKYSSVVIGDMVVKP